MHLDCLCTDLSCKTQYVFRLFQPEGSSLYLTLIVPYRDAMVTKLTNFDSWVEMVISNRDVISMHYTVRVHYTVKLYQTYILSCNILTPDSVGSPLCL